MAESFLRDPDALLRMSPGTSWGQSRMPTGLRTDQPSGFFGGVGGRLPQAFGPGEGQVQYPSTAGLDRSPLMGALRGLRRLSDDQVDRFSDPRFRPSLDRDDLLNAASVVPGADTFVDVWDIGQGLLRGDPLMTGAGAAGLGVPVAGRVLRKGGEAAEEAAEAAAREIPDNPLAVVHNTSMKGPEVAERLGGIPNPSLAVTRADDPLTKFGSISLVAPPSLLDDPRVRVFDRDIFTVRQPRSASTLRIFSPEGNAVLERFSSNLDELPEQIEQHIRGVNPVSASVDPVSGSARARPVIETRLAHIMDDPALRQEFVQEFTQRASRIDAANATERAVLEGRLISDLARETRWGFEDFLERNTARAFRDPITDELVEETAENVSRSMNRLAEKRSTVAARVDDVQNRADPSLIDLRATEREGSFGAGEVAASLAEELAGRREVETLRGTIAGAKEVTQAIMKQEALESQMSKLLNSGGVILSGSQLNRAALNYLQETRRLRRLNPGQQIDGLEEAVEALEAAKWDAAATGPLSSDMIETFQQYAEAIAGTPTEYLEAKATRVIGLDEFRGALVPNMGADFKEVLSVLERAGVPVERFSSTLPGDRRRALRKFKDLLFLLGAGTASRGLLEDPEQGGLLGVTPSDQSPPMGGGLLNF